MVEKISDIINEFDPLELPFALPDGYEKEIKEIILFLSSKQILLISRIG